MADTYKGDSPAKKLVRLKFWQTVRSALGDRRFFDGRYMVLAGREGADVRCLRALGANESRMLAVDREQRAAASVAERYRCAVAVGNVGDVATQSENRQAFDAVLLDFCSPISDAAICDVARAAAFCLRDRGVLGVGFMYGRERALSSERMAPFRGWCDAVVGGETEEEAGERMADLLPSDFGTMSAAPPYIHARSQAEFAAVGARLQLYGSALTKRLSQKYPIGAYGIWGSHYVSQSRRSKGIPMMYVATRIVRMRKRLSMGGRAESSMLARMQHAEPERPYYLPPLRLGETEAGVRDLAIRMVRGGTSSASVADLLNLSTATVAAWLAHDTMGTYKETA
jgi:hypothetical protein